MLKIARTAWAALVEKPPNRKERLIGRAGETRLPDKVRPKRAIKPPINTPTATLTLSDFTFGRLTVQLKRPGPPSAPRFQAWAGYAHAHDSPGIQCDQRFGRPNRPLG